MTFISVVVARKSHTLQGFLPKWLEYGSSDRLLCLICHFWKCNLPIDLHVRRLAVCRLIGWSICQNFRKRQEVTLPCSYWSTCYLMLTGFWIAVYYVMYSKNMETER